MVAAVLGFLWYLQVGGWRTLDPTNISWIMNGDWRQHYLGWLFFRDAPWAFPLGTISTLPYPVGTTVGFTDSNPLVAILLKPFASWLPPETQFIGPFLALCFTLQGYFGATLAGLVTRRPVEQILSGFFFVLTPVLAIRVGHDTLCAHWLLMGLLYLLLRDYGDSRSATRAMGSVILLVAIASGTHPYLAAMAVCLALACFLRLWIDRMCSPGRAIGAAMLTLATVFLIFYTVGYLTGESGSAGGFGVYSADLLTFINPYIMSNWFRPDTLPMQKPQWEGLAYLGLGGLIALACAVVTLGRFRPHVPNRVWIAASVAGLLAVFALSQHVTVAGKEIVDLTALYAPFEEIATVFRSSGRFIWPLHYLVLLLGLWGVSRLGRQARRIGGAGALAAIVLLQAIEVRFDPYWFQPKTVRFAPVADFELAKGRFRHLALAPMQVEGLCGDPYEEAHLYRFMFLAAQLKLTFNSGVFARVDAASIDAACIRLEQQVNAGTLDRETIYVVSPASVDRFQAIGATCGRFDGDWICVTKDSDERFRRYVGTGK